MIQKLHALIHSIQMLCWFCKKEPAESECATCKRSVCWQCAESHNCYPRD